MSKSGIIYVTVALYLETDADEPCEKYYEMLSLQ